MSKFVCLKHGKDLVAADAGAEAAMQKFKQGSLVMVEVKQPRNLQMHRLYWALIQKVADNIEGDFSAETVSDVIKIRIGHVDTVKTAGGIVQTPKSISFAALDQTEFRDFWDRAVAFICTEVIPGMASADLEREIYSMVA